MGSARFVSREVWRTTEIGRGGDLTRTEIVHEDGRVEWHVKGDAGDEGWIDQRGVRKYEGPLDLDVVRAARARAGWTETAK